MRPRSLFGRSLPVRRTSMVEPIGVPRASSRMEAVSAWAGSARSTDNVAATGCLICQASPARRATTFFIKHLFPEFPSCQDFHFGFLAVICFLASHCKGLAYLYYLV